MGWKFNALNYPYPAEIVDWLAMGSMDDAWWRSKDFERLSNEELVELGVFDGKIWDFKIWDFRIFIFLDIFLNFLLLDLREIEDGPDKPRGDGIRRGEVWCRISFQISQLPIVLCGELEKMSRGKSISYLGKNCRGKSNYMLLYRVGWVGYIDMF